MEAVTVSVNCAVAVCVPLVPVTDTVYVPAAVVAAVVTVSVEPLTVAVTPEGALEERLTDPVKPEVLTVAEVLLPAVTEPPVGVKETDAVTGGGVLLPPDPIVKGNVVVPVTVEPVEPVPVAVTVSG